MRFILAHFLEINRREVLRCRLSLQLGKTKEEIDQMASYSKYKTKDGLVRWKVQFYIGKNPKTGDYVKTTRRGFKRKQDAEEAVRKILNELDEGKYVGQDYTTFSAIYQEWIILQSKILKPSSMQNKKSKFAKHILPNFAELAIKDITTNDCQKFIDDLSKKILSFKDYGIQLNLVFKYALKKGYINNNPMKNIVYPLNEEDHLAVDNNKTKFWDKDTINYFLKRCEEELSFRDYSLFRLFLFSGIRKGELLALEEKDLLIDSKQLVINKNLFWRDGNYLLLRPKTENAIRTIKLDNETFEVLLKLIKLNHERRSEWGNPKNIHHFLFPRENLQPMRLAYPNDKLNSACKRFKLPNIKIHGLRHTHASMLFASGARMKDVQMRLGHSRIATTMDIYTHVTKQSEENISNLLVDYLNDLKRL